MMTRDITKKRGKEVGNKGKETKKKTYPKLLESTQQQKKKNTIYG